MAGAARDARIDIDPVARLDGVDLIADGDNFACRVEPIDRGQRRQRQEREPFGVMGDDVLHVRDHAASLDLDQHIGRPRRRDLDPIDRHLPADPVKPRSAHHGHVTSLLRGVLCSDYDGLGH